MPDTYRFSQIANITDPITFPFVEAANFAIRFNSRIKSFYQKKKSKSHAIVAIKAVAHKLCRLATTLSKIRLRLISPRRLPEREV